MANWYINPGLGTGTNAGTSWANAFNSTTLAWTAAITASAAGDDFYVNAASTVTNTAVQTLAFKGTAAAPNRVFSCSGITNNPPVSADLGVGAAHTVTTATGVITVVTGFVYIYGCNFNVGNTGTVSMNLLNNVGSEITLDSCQLNFPSSGTSTLNINPSASVGNKLTLINTPIKFASATSTINPGNVQMFWKNTPSAIPTGSSATIATLFALNGTNQSLIICDSVDFAGGVGIASGKNLVSALSNSQVIQFINCKTIAGVLVGRPTAPGGTIDQIVTDSGATGYKQQRDTYQGTLTADNVKFNNATDGTTPISWKVITTANAKPQSPFECFQITQWVAAGTYAASKVFCTSATAALTTADVWVDVEYLGPNFALGSPATSFGAGSGGPGTLPQIPAGTTPGALAASSPAWGTGGSGNDYQLVIPSFATSTAGYVRFIIKVGKASLTINIDPAVKIA